MRNCGDKGWGFFDGGVGGELFKGSTSEAALFVPSEGYRTTRLKECQSVALKWLAMNASLREKKKKKKKGGWEEKVGGRARDS